MRGKDWTGQWFGHAQALQKLPPNEAGDVQWEVKCGCGAMMIRLGKHLRIAREKKVGVFCEECVGLVRDANFRKGRYRFTKRC